MRRVSLLNYCILLHTDVHPIPQIAICRTCLLSRPRVLNLRAARTLGATRRWIDSYVVDAIGVKKERESHGRTATVVLWGLVAARASTGVGAILGGGFRSGTDCSAAQGHAHR